MRVEQVDLWLSNTRFEAYRDACGDAHERAVALYNWNVEVSAAFMETICHVEVLFRNSINRRFPATRPEQRVSVFSSQIWLSDGSVLTDESRERVNDAVFRLVQEGREPTRDRVVASLSFGFWRALFVGRYDDLWRANLVHAFPHGNGRRKEVGELAQSILKLRNKVAHHEAIFSLDLMRRHEIILKLADLMDPDAAVYIGNLSRVSKLLLEKP